MPRTSTEESYVNEAGFSTMLVGSFNEKKERGKEGRERKKKEEREGRKGEEITFPHP